MKSVIRTSATSATVPAAFTAAITASYSSVIDAVGVGRVIPTDATLLKRINAELCAPINKAEWQKRHYDDYMDAADTLHTHEKQAAQYARHLLDIE